MFRRLFACLCVALLLVCLFVPLQASAVDDTELDTAYKYLTEEKGYTSASASAILACVRYWEQEHPEVPTFLRDNIDMANYYRTLIVNNEDGTSTVLDDTIQRRIDYAYILLMRRLLLPEAWAGA